MPSVKPEFTSRDDFELARKKLGEGGFSTTWLVTRKNSQPQDPSYYVLKQVNLTRISSINDSKQADKITENCRQEFANMQACSHPNVVRVFGCFEDTEKSLLQQTCYYLVMEYCEGGDLGELIRAKIKAKEKFPEHVIENWSRQLVAAVQFLHSHNYVHRDIKPNNIYLTNENETIKLGDFGLAKDVSLVSQSTITLVGTPAYYAPEFCTCNQPWTTKCDVWALGVVVYELANLLQPFYGDGFAVVMAIWKKDPEPFPSNTIYSKNLQSFVMAMLTKNPDSRPSIDEVAKHLFLVKKIPEKPTRNPSFGDYEKVRKLSSQYSGPGSISNTWLVKRSGKSNHPLVLKRFQLSEGTRELLPSFRQEAQLMQGSIHQNLIRLYDFFDEPDFFSLVTEYCEGGSLAVAIRNFHAEDKRFDETLLKRWAQQLTSAITYLHEVDYLHQDIRPKNIFLSSNSENLKLGIMYLGALYSSSKRPVSYLLSASSQAPYLPPELAKIPQQHVYSAKSDVWCLGATFYELANLKRPVAADFAAAFKVIAKKDVQLDDEQASTSSIYSQSCLNFIDHMLEAEPEKRPNIWQVAGHPFLATANRNLVNQEDSMLPETKSAVSSTSTGNEADGEEDEAEEVLLKSEDSSEESEKPVKAEADSKQRHMAELFSTSKPVIAVGPNPKPLPSVPKLNAENLLLAAQNGELTVLRQFLSLEEGSRFLAERRSRVNWAAIPDNFSSNAKNVASSGDRLLHRACRFHQYETVRLLVDEFQAPINVRNQRGALPCHIAAAKGDLASFEFLTANLPESLEAKVSTLPNFVRQAFSKIESLLKANTTPSSLSIHLAAENGHADVVRACLRRNRQLVDARDELGNTPLCRAAASLEASEDSLLQVFKVLVDTHGAQPNQGGFRQRTPLMFACERGRLKLAKYLIEKGAHLLARDEPSRTTTLHLAAELNRVEIIEYFCRYWPELVDARDKAGSTPLNRAAYAGALGAVEFLINRTQADVDNRGRKGRTPFLEASARGHLTVVKFLANNGANLYAVDGRNKNTALHLAAFYGHDDVADYLRRLRYSRGIDLAVLKNDNGETADTFASRYGITTSPLYQLARRKGSTNYLKAPEITDFHAIV